MFCAESGIAMAFMVRRSTTGTGRYHGRCFYETAWILAKYPTVQANSFRMQRMSTLLIAALHSMVYQIADQSVLGPAGEIVIHLQN